MPWPDRAVTADGGAAGEGLGAPNRSAAGRLLTLAYLLLAGACAKQEAPPGALPDQSPPRVLETRPATDTVVSGFDGALRVRFNEPVEPNRSLSRQMAASPAYRYTVSFGFSGFEVRPEGGWRPAVYRFVFPPPFTDLLGNRSEDTLVVTFSTGPPLTATRVAGRIRDRVTGEPVSGARTSFLAIEGDSVPYGAVADGEGAFLLPGVPTGAYAAYGFEDLNATRSLERVLEPHDSARFELSGPSDSVYLDLLLVEPDTTPPQLLSARARDSLRVVLAFDDPVAPDRGLAAARVRVEPTGEGGPVPVVELLLARDTTASEPAAAAHAAGARPDSAALDTTAAPDTTVSVDTAAARDTVAEGDTLAAADTLAPGDTLALPDTLVVARLGRPLVPDRDYRVSAEGIENLRRLSGGGDTTFVYAPSDTVAGDTLPGGGGPASRDTLPGAPSEGLPEAVPDTVSHPPRRQGSP